MGVSPLNVQPSSLATFNFPMSRARGLERAEAADVSSDTVEKSSRIGRTGYEGVQANPCGSRGPSEMEGQTGRIYHLSTHNLMADGRPSPEIT